MLTYILKRLGSTVLILFGATLISFVMVINSGDPLADLRELQDEHPPSVDEPDPDDTDEETDKSIDDQHEDARS